VQRWAWYSLNDRLFEGRTSRSHLFEPSNRQITALGLAFGDYTQALACPAYVDLLPAALTYQRSDRFSRDGRPITVTLTALVRNAGNADARNVEVQFWTTGPGHQIAGIQTIPHLAARSQASVSVEWESVAVGKHTVGVTVDPLRYIAESDEANNQLSHALLVGQHEIDIPLIIQGHTGGNGF
jgi:hypothetical protein